MMHNRRNTMQFITAIFCARSHVRIVLMCVLCVLIIGCTPISRVNEGAPEVQEPAELSPVPTVEVTQTSEPIAEPTLMPTATAAPLTGIDALKQFMQMPMTVVWSDTFDDTTSGWEPRFEMVDSKNKPATIPSYLTIPYNGYVNGAYEFYVKAADANALAWIPDTLQAIHAPELWDFNSTQALPAYPYTILAEMEAVRDTNAVLFADYQGDFGNINDASGIMVVVTLRETESTLGPDFANLQLSVFSVYEMRPGQLWNLNCSGDDTLPDVRRAVVALHVDQDAIMVELASDAQSNQRVVQTCRRAQPGLTDAPRYVGLGAVYTNSLEIPTVEDEAKRNKELRAPGLLRVNTLVVGQRTTPLQIESTAKSPEPIAAHRCINQYPWMLPSEILGWIRGKDFNLCDPGVGAPDIPPLMIVPYDDAEIASLEGTWQCGNDQEHRLKISQKGAFLQIANADVSRQLVLVTDDYHENRGKHYMVVEESESRAFGERIWPKIRGWQIWIDDADLIMTYRNNQLNTNWAGSCSRVE